ncbi:MAG: dihydroxyacetone kinase subunit L [Brachybacterium sp.]|nr:dihydroxyacetone kinase subunit L [Brachybacterium sp.]
MTTTTTSTDTLPDDFGHAFIRGVHEHLGGAADPLGDLDRRAGDGDFGTNVRTALKHAAENIETDKPSTYRQWGTTMYMGWLAVGGTSGPLFGMFFRDLAKAADDDGEPTLAQFAEALAAGQATIQKYGEAKVGDKTMVDALDPAVTALHTAVEAGTPPGEALATAEKAAVEAAQATAETTARRGRASYVGDVAKGVIDPGAAAMALVIGAARAAVDGAEVDAAWIG